MNVEVVKLPGVCVAAAGGDTAWCAAGDRLLAFTETGSVRHDVPLTTGVSQLAAVDASLVATIDSSRVAWLDPGSGRVLAAQAIGGVPQLVSGGGAVWAIDPDSSRAWRVRETRMLDAPRRVQGVDRAAAEGDRLWWTTKDGTLLRDFDRTVDIGVAAGDRGAMVVCANSVWISVARGLSRVGAWQASKGPTLRAPEGPVPFLVCARGALVGVSERGSLFVLDPTVDADVRALGSVDGGRISEVIAVNDTVWIFSAEQPEARLLRVRPA